MMAPVLVLSGPVDVGSSDSLSATPGNKDDAYDDLFEMLQNCVDCHSKDCFPESATVTTPAGRKRMSELKLGDRVLDRDLTWAPIVAFLDVKGGRHVYKEIQYNGQEIVRLTSNHLIFRQKAGGEIEDVPAYMIKAGDTLMLTNGTGRVVETRLVTDDGACAPMTSTGSMLVDDVWVSCFVSNRMHDFANHRFVQDYVFAPLRGLSKVVDYLGHDTWLKEAMFGGGGKEDGGILWYARFLMSLQSLF